MALTSQEGSSALVLPKGGVKRNESIEAAAEREIAEEAGLIDLMRLSKLAVLDRMDALRSKWITTHYFLYWTATVGGAPTDRLRRYAVTWTPIHQLPDMFWPEQRQLIELNADAIETAVRDGALGRPVRLPDQWRTPEVFR